MPSSLQDLHTRDGNNGRGDGWTDGWMDGQPWRSKSRGGGRERSERADRERSEHATASCVRRLLRRHQFISDAVCPLCAHSLLSASRGHRHRFSSPPHPSIHPRHTIPSSTTAIQSRINTVTIKASERERGRRPPCQTSTTMAEGAKKRPDLGRSRLLLPQTVPVAPALNRED